MNPPKLKISKNSSLPSELLRPTTITFGSFNGLHRGHVSLINQVVTESQRSKTFATLLTFYPHPLSVLKPGLVLPALSSLRTFVADCCVQGLSQIHFVRFTRSLSLLSAEEFLNRYVVIPLQPHRVYVGEDAAVGNGRQGDLEFMSRYFYDRNIEFSVVPFLKDKGKKVGSREVRRALSEGDLGTVQTLLGRPYSLEGKVIRGEQRGRTIGFPTANIASRGQEIPPYGVYRTLCVVNNTLHRSISNIGIRPTFSGNTCSIETHVLDGFDDDIYGCHMEVFVFEKLRGEEKFSSVQALTEQISADCNQASTVPNNEDIRLILYWRPSVEVSLFLNQHYQGGLSL